MCLHKDSKQAVTSACGDNAAQSEWKWRHWNELINQTKQDQDIFNGSQKIRNNLQCSLPLAQCTHQRKKAHLRGLNTAWPPGLNYQSVRHFTIRGIHKTAWHIINTSKCSLNGPWPKIQYPHLSTCTVACIKDTLQGHETSQSSDKLTPSTALCFSIVSSYGLSPLCLHSFFSAWWQHTGLSWSWYESNYRTRSGVLII